MTTQLLQPLSATDHPAGDGGLVEFEEARHRKLLKIGLIAVAAVPAVGVATRSGDAAVQTGLVVIYLAILLMVSRACKPRTPWPYASPITTLTFVWMLMYGVYSINKFLDVTTVHAALRGSYREFHLALIMVMFSNLLMLGGYLLVFPSPISDPRPRVLKGALSVPALAVVWLVSWMARGVQFSNRQYGYLSDVGGAGTGSGGGFSYQMALTYAAQSSYMVTAALALEVLLDRKNEKPIFRYLLFIVLMGEVVYTLTVGFKAVLLLTLLPAFLVMLGIGARLPLKSLAVVGLFFVVIAPGNYAYREAVNKGSVGRGDALGVLGTSFSLTYQEWSSKPGDALANTWKSVTYEMADSLENVALIVKKTPSRYPHFGAEEYKLIIPRTLFPRFLWKDKPTSEHAGIVTYIYREATAKSGSPMGFTGDLYMRTGLNGVVIGSLGIGILLGLYLKLFQRFRSRRALVLYVTVVGATLFNSEPGPMITMFIQRSLVYLVFATVLYHGDKWAGALQGMRGIEQARADAPAIRAAPVE